LPVSGVVGTLRSEDRDVVSGASGVIPREEAQSEWIDPEQRQELSEALCHMLMSVVEQYAEVV
jgi:hypothetical protein